LNINEDMSIDNNFIEKAAGVLLFIEGKDMNIYSYLEMCISLKNTKWENSCKFLCRGSMCQGTQCIPSKEKLVVKLILKNM